MDRDDRASDEWMLGDFGIAPSAELVWRCLLDRPQISRSDLVRETNLSDSQFEAVITSLTGAGLIRPAAFPIEVAAIDPSISVEMHIVRAERDLAERTSALSDLRNRLPELSSAYRDGRAAVGEMSGFEVVLGLDEVRSQIYLATERATSVVRGMQRGTTSAALRHAELSDLAALARGVRDLSLISIDNFTDPDVFEFLQRAHERGQRFRTLPAVPSQMLLMDESLAILPIDVHNSTLGAIFIRAPSVVTILVEMFDHLWSEATPTFVVDGGLDAPSDRCARVLELLSIGATDTRIARTLSIGVRTVRREVADIKALLGVSSRAEISAAALRRGWL